MAIKINYWKTFKNTERFYSTGKADWEVCIRRYEQGDKVEMVVDFPRECRGSERKDFKRKFAIDKRIAQSVTT